LRDLDSINPAEAKPARFVGTGAILPLVFGTLGVVLAHHAAPTVPSSQNPIWIFCIIIVGLAVAMFPVPRLFKWNWETKYFGVPLFYLGSLTLMCVIPCLCLLLYSKLEIWSRAAIFLAYMAIHIAWIWRFVAFYRKVDQDSVLRASLYEEENDAVYYMQQADKRILETQFDFHQLPRDRYFVLFIVAALSTTPMMRSVTESVGLPFIHVFFLIGTLPISLMGLGFATRGLLVFYCYPRKIRKTTGKRVYVDMGSKPKNLVRGGKRKNR
jgi:hypothetical protein